MFAILILLITLICGLYLKKRNRYLVESSKNIPGPRALPLLGNGIFYFSKPSAFLNYSTISQKTYGSVTRHWIGPNLYFFLSNPADVEIILKDGKNINKSPVYDDLLRWLGQGLITLKSQNWLAHRKAIAPSFHFNILEKFVEVFNEKGKVLIKLLKKEADKDTFDIYPFVNYYAFDAILETSMGTHCNYQEEHNNPYVKAIHGITKLSHVRAFNPILRLPYIYYFTKYRREEEEYLNIIQDYCTKVIKQKRENLNEMDTQKDPDDTGIKKRRAFLDLLLIDQINGSGFTDQDIINEVNTILFAGHDAFSTAMSFSLYYLSKNQDIQEKAFQEVNNLFGSETDELTFQDLQNCQYMELIIKEMLRIAPPVPIFGRLLETDLKLTNYTLPRGSNVGIFTYMVHHNPEIYPEPEKFDPERFTAENSRKRHPYAFLPFSAGIRNCIGQKYAMIELKATLVKIISNFRILPGDDIKNLEVVVVLKSTNGINVKLESRS